MTSEGLAGVVTCAAGLTIARDLRSAAASRRASLRVGAVGPVPLPAVRPMEAQRADGAIWRRHWVCDGLLVCEFADLACVSVDRDGTITFDRTLDPEMEEHLLFDHLLPLVLARDGHLVLHGGLISRAERGVALVGSSGAGKSTLAGYAWDQGWTLGSDDGVVMSPGRPPRAEPTYATLRLTPAGADLIGIDATATSPVVGKLRADGGPANPFHQAPVDLIAVVVVEPDETATAASFEPQGGMEAHAELFGSTFHADFARDYHLPRVLADLAAVVESCTVGRLRVPRGRSGLVSAEQQLSALVDAPS